VLIVYPFTFTGQWHCGQQMYRGSLMLCLTLAALSSALSTSPPSFFITLCRMLPPPLSIGKLSLSLSSLGYGKNVLISNFTLSDVLFLLSSHRGCLSLCHSQAISLSLSLYVISACFFFFFFLYPFLEFQFANCFMALFFFFFFIFLQA
jgi:hypothetical protein